MNNTNSGINTFESWGEIPEERVRIPDEEWKPIVDRAVSRAYLRIKLPINVLEDKRKTLDFKELAGQNDVIGDIIKLNQHAKEVEKLLITPVNKECPPVPKISHGKKRPIITDQEPEEVIKILRPYNFLIGQGPTLPMISSDTSYELLKQAVVIMLCQAGFDNARLSCIHTLVDIVIGRLTKLTRLLHDFSQNDIISEPYDDVVEKALKFVGMAGYASIKKYWTEEVEGKRNKALKKSCVLVNTYKKLTN